MSEVLTVGWDGDPLHPDAPLDTLVARPTAVQRLRARSRSYRATLPRTAQGLHDPTHSDVLTRAAAAQDAVTAGQVAVLQACVDWAALHGEAAHGEQPRAVSSWSRSPATAHPRSRSSASPSSRCASGSPPRPVATS